MRIVVVGGTGLVGSKLMRALNDRGHDAVAAAPSVGVDAVTGKGLPVALAGASVVVVDGPPPATVTVALATGLESTSSTVPVTARPFAGCACAVTRVAIKTNRSANAPAAAPNG